MTFAALRTRRLPRGPFCVTETVQESFLHSGASKMGSPSAPHQVCSVLLETLISYNKCGLVMLLFSFPLPDVLSLIVYRIPGSRLWLGRLLETMWSRGSSSKLLPQCKSPLVHHHVNGCVVFVGLLSEPKSQQGIFENDTVPPLTHDLSCYTVQNLEFVRLMT